MLMHGGRMKTRGRVLIGVGAVLIAALFFYLGSYVFPHAPSSRPAADVATPGSPTAGSLEGVGISVPGGAAAPVSGTGSAASPTGSEEPLDMEAIESLDEPARGRLIGRFVKRSSTDDAIVVDVDSFIVLMADEAGTSTRRAVPAGSTVTLVLPPVPQGVPEFALPEPGRTIIADVRIEPPRDGAPGRVVAVRIEVPGDAP